VLLLGFGVERLELKVLFSFGVSVNEIEGSLLEGILKLRSFYFKVKTNSFKRISSMVL